MPRFAPNGQNIQNPVYHEENSERIFLEHPVFEYSQLVSWRSLLLEVVVVLEEISRGASAQADCTKNFY